MYNLPVFNLVAGEQLSIRLNDPSQVPGATGNPVKAVQLQNLSGFTLTLRGNQTLTIPPGMNDLILLPSPTTNAQIDLTVGAVNQLPSASTAILQGVVYENLDKLPTNSFPMVNAASMGATVNIFPPALVSSTTDSVSLSSGDNKLLVPAAPSGKMSVLGMWSIATVLTVAEGQITIQGATSGMNYWSTDVPILSTSVPPMSGIFQYLQVTEALNAVLTGGSSGHMSFTVTFIVVPI